MAQGLDLGSRPRSPGKMEGIYLGPVVIEPEVEGQPR
jgi:hypothetical protein